MLHGSTVQRLRKVATNSHEHITAWTPAQERQGTALRRDASSTAQRSRKVAINCHEYVVVWTPAQVHEARYRTAHAWMLVLLCRYRERSLLPLKSTSLPGRLYRSGKVPHCAGMVALLCRDRGTSPYYSRHACIGILTSLPRRLRRRGKVRTAQECWLHTTEIEKGRY